MCGIAHARVADPRHRAPPAISDSVRATFCKGNPFITDWTDGDFAKAYQQTLAYKADLASKAQQTLWGAVNHSRFDIAPPSTRCDNKRRVGGEGDGGKWICGIDNAPLLPGCIIYSLGSDYDFKLEEALIASTPCEVFTLDCTVNSTNARFPKGLSPRIHFYPYCVGGSNFERSTYHRSVGSLAAELGHGRITLLKADVEGAEWRVFSALYADFLWGKVSNEAPPLLLPDQILVEMHYGAYTSFWQWPKQASPHRAALSAGEMALTWLQLLEMGYVVVNREDNPLCNDCAEFTLVRALC